MIDMRFKAADGTDDYVTMFRADFVGNARERGYAHGALFAAEIVEFTGPQLDKYYDDQLPNLDISRFPEPIHTYLEELKAKVDVLAPEVFKAAMNWVWESELPWVPQKFIDEMDGMGEGMCASLGADCDPKYWAAQIKELNMLPELIKMTCTAFGAWGKATPDGGLVQLRALDFGGGPFANYTVVMVHRGDPANPDHAFVSVGFPAFVGVITGVAQNGVGISEKVWMISDQTPDLQPGSFQGLADVLVLRDVLETSKSRKEAVDYIQAVNRTWGMWVGVGDFEQNFNLVAYRQEDANAYTDETMPPMNGQPRMTHLAYVDKHTQPSHYTEGANTDLPTVLKSFYGAISLQTVKSIVNFHTTGDLHWAAYDFTRKQMVLAIGRTDADGEYGPGGVWEAHNRPALLFDLADLWAGI